MLRVKGQKEHEAGVEEPERGREKMKEIFRLLMDKKAHLLYI